MSAVIAVLAEYRAKKIVKDQIRREGKKISDYRPRDITIMAHMWLEVHRTEAIADAREMIASSPELTKMYEKEQRQRAKLSSDAQQPQPCFDTTISVQISGAK